MKQLIIISFLFSTLFGQTNFVKGMEQYLNRAEGSSGMKAQAGPINSAISLFESSLSENEEESMLALLKCYYYKGKFVLTNVESKKSIFQKGKDLGESSIEKYPKSASLRYWYLANLGSWSEVYGILTAAKDGVSDIMKTQAEEIISLDPYYWNGGGYFMLGAVHFKSPYIPFILSWPDNDDAVSYLTQAYETGRSTFTQTVYLARALHKDKQKTKAIQILTDLIQMPLSDDEPVEDFEQQSLAKDLLNDWE
ncbi:MAG: hypothetical protein HN514_10190 [Candidatus Marinimicrobia bacterium]|jgi:hypothetical protein|nr:hypothetical protein [Candidatus Neomarinimicrobiota bacterium]MBT6112267.1 hypothetical protein [Candidatus Neomarinimicrobiota bacterium]